MPKKSSVTTGTENVLKIIEFLASRGKVRVRESARELNVAPSTALRFLQTLVQLGFASVEKETRLYRPGLHFLQVAIQLQEQFTLTRVARPILENLFSLVHETVNLGILSDDLKDVIHIDKIITDRVVRIDTNIGGAAPSYCTALGKVMLAFRPTAEVDACLKQFTFVSRTPNTLVDPAELVRHLADVRGRGYAVDLEEYSEHLECVAAPVLNDRGMAVAGISISRLVVPGERDLDAVAVEVVRAAQILSKFVTNVH